MTVSLRLSDSDANLIKKYAEVNNLSVSELVRQSVIQRIEDEYDLELFNNAIKEFNQNKITYTIDEVERELGL